MNMRLFRGFFFVLGGLFVFITILSLFIPSKLMVTRATVIHADAGNVFSQIADLQNWKHWQPVFVSDSANIKFDTDPDGLSSSCEWNSQGRKNSLRITDRRNNAIAATLSREGENDVLNTIKILPLADSSQVQVEWNVLIRLKWYPWEKFYGIFIEKITGEGYEAALNSLKEYAENH